MSALLDVEGLTVTFGTAAPAVRDLSLSIPRGGSLGLVGESGSGKTMTALAILGLTPPRARIEARRMTFGDLDLLAIGERGRQRLRGARIGYVPQDPLAALNSLLLVGDQITEVERLHAPRRRWRNTREVARGYGLGSRSPETVRRAGELLAEVRISDPEARAAQYPAELSGGMRQRAIIAGAVSTNPDLLIADEPTTALDASVEKQVLDLLSERRRVHDTAMLLVTHDLNIASWHCDDIVVLYAGRTMESGPTERIFSRPRHPYTAALMAATPDLERPPASRERRRGVDARASAGCPFAARCPNATGVCFETFPETTEAGDGHRYWCHNPL